MQETPIVCTPCTPSPCGLNSQCRELNNHAVCSCLPDMIGAPPNCRPECLVSSECALDKSCINQKCKNPCVGVCGQHARCQVVNHNPICSCEIGYTGDPFIRCIKEEVRHPIVPIQPIGCVPTPCGPNSQCREVGDTPVCSCLPNYIGRAPNCRPECVTNSECSRNFACINERCMDPCIGVCSSQSTCNVYNHQAVCRCPEGFTGDPFVACTAIPSNFKIHEVEGCQHSNGILLKIFNYICYVFYLVSFAVMTFKGMDTNRNINS